MFYIFFSFIFRWSLGGVYQCATLKIAKWHLLTWSQLCLSPSHFKHSPTLLTLSQWGRQSLNMKVDETWLITQQNSDSNVTTHSPGCSGACWINECIHTLFFCFRPSAWTSTVRENSPAVKMGVWQNPPGTSNASPPKEILLDQRKNSLLNGWLAANMDGEVH